jgi:hypothetical protein
VQKLLLLMMMFLLMRLLFPMHLTRGPRCLLWSDSRAAADDDADALFPLRLTTGSAYPIY